MGPAYEVNCEEFDMEQVDLKAVTGDEQSFRMFVVMALATLGERVGSLEGMAKAASSDALESRDRLIQIDLNEAYGRERVETHEKWLDEMRKEFANHEGHCSVGDKMAGVEEDLHQALLDAATRAETLKAIPQMQKDLQTLTVAVAENTGARGQKENDWRTTLIMIGMALTALFSIIAMFRKGLPG